MLLTLLPWQPLVYPALESWSLSGCPWISSTSAAFQSSFFISPRICAVRASVFLHLLSPVPEAVNIQCSFGNFPGWSSWGTAGCVSLPSPPVYLYSLPSCSFTNSWDVKPPSLTPFSSFHSHVLLYISQISRCAHQSLFILQSLLGCWKDGVVEMRWSRI